MTASAIGLALPAEDEVHVWYARLDIPDADVPGFYETLSDDEKQRAGRFQFEKHQKRFIAGRGILRELIGRYLHVDPAQIAFDYTAQGKPRIASPNDHNFQCNISHSADLALFAFV